MSDGWNKQTDTFLINCQRQIKKYENKKKSCLDRIEILEERINELRIEAIDQQKPYASLKIIMIITSVIIVYSSLIPVFFSIENDILNLITAISSVIITIISTSIVTLQRGNIVESKKKNDLASENEVNRKRIITKAGKFNDATIDFTELSTHIEKFKNIIIPSKKKNQLDEEYKNLANRYKELINKHSKIDLTP